MKNKRSIKQKILLYILSSFTLFFAVSVAYIVTTSRNSIFNETIEKTHCVAKKSSAEIEKFFEKNLTITRTLAQAFSVYHTMPANQWQSLFTQMYLPIIKANEQVYIIWDSWEYSGYVPNYDKSYGRLMMYVLRDGNSFEVGKEERSLDGDPEIYGRFKQGNKDDIWEPYLDVVEEGKREAKMMTTIASPVKNGGKFMGMVGLDLELTLLQNLVETVEVPKGGMAILISPQGVIAGHPDNRYISKHIDDIFPLETEAHGILKKIQDGQEYFFSRRDENGKSHYVFFSPVTVSGVSSSWSLAVSVPYSQIMLEANRTLVVSLIVGVLALAVVIVILILISNALTRPIQCITSTLNAMSKGEIDLDKELKVSSGDEVEEMANALNLSIEGLHQKTEFALSIGAGQFDAQLQLLGEKDMLGKSLIAMRDSLKLANVEDEKRQEEDRKRAWVNEGLNQFADILRRNNDSIQALSDEITSGLVKYLSANQAALFLLEETDEPYFNMVSAYAWDRKKFMNKKVGLEEGLVGACALEKETIELTEIPEDYVEITSGLGKATPSYVVLVPLKHEEEVLGVIELAAFRIFEAFELEFFEQAARSIASTLLAVKINERTRLLLEQSKRQAEELLAQEEEMRQNMEELQATQEEMERKALEQDNLRKHYEEEIAKLKQELDHLRGSDA